MTTPNQTSARPASTVPVTLAGAEISLMSSMNPTAKITSAASSTPNGSELLSKTTSNDPISQAVASAATNPTNIANPPTSGSGVWWTVRSLGRYTQPCRFANRMTIGVATNVTTAATAPISR